MFLGPGGFFPDMVLFPPGNKTKLAIINQLIDFPQNRILARRGRVVSFPRNGFFPGETKPGSYSISVGVFFPDAVHT